MDKKFVFVCPKCGPSEMYPNGLCAICSTEKQQRERDAYISFVSGREFPFSSNGAYVFKDNKDRLLEHMGMVDAGVLYISPTSTEYMVIFRVTDSYLAMLDAKSGTPKPSKAPAIKKKHT